MAAQPRGKRDYLQLFTQLAGGAGCIQSLLWIGMTICGIVFYSTCEDTLPPKPSDYLGSYIKTMYFTRDDCFNTKTVRDSDHALQRPKQILIWVAVYLGLSAIWFILSVLLLFNVNEKNYRKTYIYIHAWVYGTFVLCVVDIAMGSLFGRDMHYISNYIDSATNLNDAMYYGNHRFRTAAGVMMAVALRGFVLWLINFSLSVFLLMCLIDVHKELADEAKNSMNHHSVLSRGPIAAYENEESSPSWLTGLKSIQRLQPQQPNPRTSIYYRSQNYQGETNPVYLHSPDRAKRNAEPTGIMKPTPPWQRSSREPSTPAPDYSPPASRASRAAAQRASLKADPAPSHPWG